MSQKDETPALILSLLITLGVLGGGIWWFTQRTGTNLGTLFQPKPTPGQTSTPAGTSSAESFSQVQNIPVGLFSYGGSTTWAPLRRDIDPLIQTVWPNFRLRYTDPATGAPGSGKGIQMLLDNQLTFAQSSRAIETEEYQAAQQRGFTLREIPVAIDGIAIAVHPTLNLSGITVAQLKDIYTGKIRNWSQVGGPNLAVTPYSRRPEEGGTIEFFIGNVLEDAPFGNNVQLIPTTTQALRLVSNNPGGIYYASAPELVPQCTVKPLPIGRKPNEWVPPYQEPLVSGAQCPGRRNQVNAAAFQSGQYPITRRLFVIVKQNGQVDQQAGEAYANLLLTTQAQALLDKTGFVRIR